MEIAGTLAALAVCAVRDAVLYHERLLHSETLRKRADYEEYLVDLSVFLDEIVYKYRKIEASLDLPLDSFFELDVPVLVYAGSARKEDVAGSFIKISDPHALLMVSSVRDAMLYRESFLRDEASTAALRDQKEYLAQLALLLEAVKGEYRKIESRIGVPLARILHQE
jgi:hypothetical protein